MRTSEVIEQLSGSYIPTQSVYQALRTLVKRRQLSVRKEGREHLYTWIGGGSSSRALPRTRPAPVSRRFATDVTLSPEDGTPRASAAEREVAAAVAEEGALSVVAAEPREKTMHHLIPGEIVILEMTETHVTSARNEFGKLVVERHPRRSKSSEERAG